MRGLRGRTRRGSCCPSASPARGTSRPRASPPAAAGRASTWSCPRRARAPRRAELARAHLAHGTAVLGHRRRAAGGSERVTWTSGNSSRSTLPNLRGAAGTRAAGRTPTRPRGRRRGDQAAHASPSQVEARKLDAVGAELGEEARAAGRSTERRAQGGPSSARSTTGRATNRSWSVTTSPSMPAISVICVTRREPSTSRAMWTIRSNAAGDLLADRLDRQLDAGHQHEHLEPVQRVARRVRVDGRQRAVVAGVHRLEHVERLGAADLADDDPVGPHAERVADQVADADLALALDVRRARLERDDVPLLQLQLGRVLDRDDPLVAGDEGGDGVQERRLAGAGAARDEDVELAARRTARGTRPPAR